MKAPDARRSVAQYRELAPRYDQNCRRIIGVRGTTIALLGLKPGDVVVDVASGTGLSFALLMQAIGPVGHLVAIENSPEMMALARERVLAAGWRNVTLIEASVEEADIEPAFDAVLFQFAHDVLQSPAALSHLFSFAKSTARVAAAGNKFATWWLAPLNLWLLFRNRHYLTTYAGLHQPWRHLLAYVPDLRVEASGLGRRYLAHGSIHPRTR